MHKEYPLSAKLKFDVSSPFLSILGIHVCKGLTPYMLQVLKTSHKEMGGFKQVPRTRVLLTLHLQFSRYQSCACYLDSHVTPYTHNDMLLLAKAVSAFLYYPKRYLLLTTL